MCAPFNSLLHLHCNNLGLVQASSWRLKGKCSLRKKLQSAVSRDWFMIESLLKIKKITATFEWKRSHSTYINNNEADRLARSAQQLVGEQPPSFLFKDMCHLSLCRSPFNGGFHVLYCNLVTAKHDLALL